MIRIFCRIHMNEIQKISQKTNEILGSLRPLVRARVSQYLTLLDIIYIGRARV